MSTAGNGSIGSAANFLGGNDLKRLASDLQQLAAPIERSEKLPVAIDRAARRAGLDYWRAWNIWYGKAKRVETAEREAIQTALAKKHREAARNELHELKTRLVVLEARLNQIDPDFYRETADQIGQQVRRIGGVACA